jgi:hypothetical protein
MSDRKIYGKIYAQYHFADSASNEKRMTSSCRIRSATYQDLLDATYLFGLEHICITEMKLTEKYFQRLSVHSNMEYVILGNCDFESDWLKYFSHYKKLHSLELRLKNNPQQWNLIKPFEKNTALCRITLVRSGITDEDIIVLDKLINLQEFILVSCVFQTSQTTERFYEFIEKRANNLKIIILSDIPNLEKHVQAIIDKPTCSTIRIESDKISDEVLNNIKMPVGHKKKIIIQSNAISDYGLMHVQLEPGIKLCLDCPKITKEGFEKFLQLNTSVLGIFKEHFHVELEHK